MLVVVESGGVNSRLWLADSRIRVENPCGDFESVKSEIRERGGNAGVRSARECYRTDVERAVVIGVQRTRDDRANRGNLDSVDESQARSGGQVELDRHPSGASRYRQLKADGRAVGVVVEIAIIRAIVRHDDVEWGRVVQA